MSDRFVYLNGEIVSAGEARISPLDRGFLLGDGFFETTRVMHGTPFRFEDHIERLERACEVTGWEWSPDGEKLRRAARKLMERNKVASGYMRLTVSRGLHDRGLTALKADCPTVLLDIRPEDLAPLEETAPIKLAPATFARNETSPVQSLKSTSYQENVLALAHGREKDADEVFFVNTEGNLAEGAISNIFLVEDGKIVTPGVDQGLLAGIGRKVVLEVCREHDIPVSEGAVARERLYEADEIFCTNSLRGVMPVQRVVGSAGEVFPAITRSKEVRRMFARRVHRECADREHERQV